MFRDDNIACVRQKKREIICRHMTDSIDKVIEFKDDMQVFHQELHRDILAS